MGQPIGRACGSEDVVAPFVRLSLKFVWVSVSPVPLGKCGEIQRLVHSSKAR